VQKLLYFRYVSAPWTVPYTLKQVRLVMNIGYKIDRVIQLLQTAYVNAGVQNNTNKILKVA
jgi:hypothetical protein